jgi:uncharacterized protein
MKKAGISYKIIVDTNVWISFLIGKSLKGLQYYIDNKKIIIITCDEQLQELIEVFRKSKLKKYFTIEQIDEFLELISEASVNVSLKTKIELCRDSKDNYLISLAVDSNADYLITGDNDLLELVEVENTQIVNYSDFDKLMKK